MNFTFPLRADDLRPEDKGTVIDAADGIAGRLLEVAHDERGTALRLDGFERVIHLFPGTLVGIDRDSWRRLWFDADRRGICREGVAEQDRLELTRRAAASHMARFQRVVSEGWDGVAAPWE